MNTQICAQLKIINTISYAHFANHSHVRESSNVSSFCPSSDGTLDDKVIWLPNLSLKDLECWVCKNSSDVTLIGITISVLQEFWRAVEWVFQYQMWMWTWMLDSGLDWGVLLLLFLSSCSSSSFCFCKSPSKSFRISSSVFLLFMSVFLFFQIWPIWLEGHGIFVWAKLLSGGSAYSTISWGLLGLIWVRFPLAGQVLLKLWLAGWM